MCFEIAVTIYKKRAVLEYRLLFRRRLLLLSAGIYIFSSSLNNFPILVLWDLVRLSIAIERELKCSYIFLFQFFFKIYCHLYNNDNVTQRGQPVPGLHQLATYVYMKFLQSLATLPKKKCSSQKHPRQVPLRLSGHSVSLGRANATYLSSSF